MIGLLILKVKLEYKYIDAHIQPTVELNWIGLSFRRLGCAF